MNLIAQRLEFESKKRIYESAKLTFHGVEGFDVYNSSIPFEWNGKRYIYGRVEKRGDWARSWTRIFENTGKDDWSVVPNSMIYPIEDPYISTIHKNHVLGGTHAYYESSKVKTYFAYFYKGTDLNDLYYFTTGPDFMKDIRLVEMSGGKIGVFSRPRSEETRRKYGSESIVGFTTINDLDELTADVIENAGFVPGLFDDGEWGGCNQVYYLSSGLLGVIGHKCYNAPDETGLILSTYMNISFIFDPESHEVKNLKIIGTRPCYPDGPAKKPYLADCAFTAGIAMRNDGKADLYSGIGDTEVGRIVIDYPFEGYGEIVGF